MNKSLISICLLLVFSTLMTHPKVTNAMDDNNKLIDEAFITSLSGPITNAVTGYYGELTQFGLYDSKIIEIKKAENEEYSFTVIVGISPFKGAHNTIGQDKVTLEISPFGATVIKYEHNEIK